MQTILSGCQAERDAFHHSTSVGSHTQMISFMTTCVSNVEKREATTNTDAASCATAEHLGVVREAVADVVRHGVLARDRLLRGATPSRNY